MKKKLLWLEDDALLGVVLSKALEATEFELIHVRDGREAIETLKEIVPDVIMVDLLVPGEMDGFGVLKAISEDARLKNIPRIVLSNLSNQADIDKARHLGAGIFIVKATSSLDLIIDQLRAQVAGK
jgi:CheY-like chemotaxis protein